MKPLFITTQDLEIGYDHQIVVPDINLTLEPGKTLALVGVNGSGKSTLLKTLAGLLPPISGNILVFGQEPGKTPSRVAYLSQFNQTSLLLPLRTIDVVRMGRFPALGLLGRITREDEKLIQESMDFMGILHLADKPLNSLSGGQRQRVFLANILAHRADLILLDEPSSNLDVPGVELYKKAVDRSLERGASLVIATHNIKEAGLCDQAMLLAQRVVAYGPGSSVLTPEALLSTFGIIARFEEGHVVVVEKEHGCLDDSDHRH